jgi:hypothetical protein
MDIVYRLASELAIMLENHIHKTEWRVRHHTVLDVLSDAHTYLTVENHPIPDSVEKVLAVSLREH